MGALLGLGLLVLVVLAGALHDLRLQPGTPIRSDTVMETLPVGQGTLQLPGLPLVATVAIWVLLILSILSLIISPDARRAFLRNLPAYLMLLLGIYLILSSLNPAEPRALESTMEIGQAGDAGELAGEPLGSPPGFVTNPPDWLIWLVALVLGLFLALILALLVRAFRRPKPANPLRDIARQAQAAVADLQAGADLRDTITRCYADMCRVLSEERKVRRDSTLTPREFEQRLILAGVQSSDVQRLTRLFELVRYSPRKPTRREEEEAVACLNSIAASDRQAT